MGSRSAPAAGARAVVLTWLAACSAPDGSALYGPLGSGGNGPVGSGAASGDGGAASVAPGSGSPFGGSSGAAASGSTSSPAGASSEGQGGTTLINGDEGAEGVDADGSGDGSGDAGAVAGDGATDAGAVDAGIIGVVPPPCIASLEVCDGLDNDCDGEVDPADTCGAACIGFALGERGYMYCADSAARAAALGACEGEGMHLAWLETPEESDALRDELAASGLEVPEDNDEILTWIGGSDAADEGEWFWVGNGAIAGSFQFWTGGSPPEGAPVAGAYVAWSPGEPTGFVNEHCAALSVLGNAVHDAGAWDDRSCNEILPFVCEAP